MKTILLIISIYVSIGLILCDCSSKIKNKPKLFEQPKEYIRNLQSTNWESIDIYIDYTHLDSQLLNKEIEKSQYNIILKILNQTKEFYSKILMVKRENNRLNIPECVNYKLSQLVTSLGLSSHLVIIPSVEEGIDIFASPCVQHAKNFRPLAGYIVFGKNLIYEKLNSLNYYTMLTIHQFNHILCFNDYLFDYFIDSEGKKINRKDVVSSNIVNGIERNIIITSKVVEQAKKHFNCDNIQGMELENQGLTSHWESRIMYSDFMTNQLSGEMVISEITLALFEDSGWYQVKPFTGGLFKYGKDKGCNFLFTKCINDNITEFKDEFSIEENEQMCFPGRTTRGVSSLKNYNEPLNKGYIYWSEITRGGLENADYCPVVTTDDIRNNFLYDSCSIGEILNKGDVIGSNSFCFISTINLNNKKAVCYPITCRIKDYIIKVENQEAMCPESGGRINIDGLKGWIDCPSFYMMCNRSVNCNNVLECANNKSIIL